MRLDFIVEQSIIYMNAGSEYIIEASYRTSQALSKATRDVADIVSRTNIFKSLNKQAVRKLQLY